MLRFRYERNNTYEFYGGEKFKVVPSRARPVGEASVKGRLAWNHDTETKEGRKRRG